MIRYLFLFLPIYLSAQSIPDYLTVPFPTELTVDKQGNKTTWVFNEAGSRNVYFAESPSYKAIRLTNFKGDDGMEISNLSFSPDGKKYIIEGGVKKFCKEIGVTYDAVLGKKSKNTKGWTIINT